MTAQLKMTCFGILSFLFLCAGCVPVSSQFVGNPVSTEQKVITLQPGGPHADSWQNFEITIDYQYKWDNDLFEISGVAELSQHYEMMYTNLRDLKVYLFFLDDQAHVLQTHMLDRSLTGFIDEKLDFTKFYKTPSGTKNIAFGYDGRVSEMEDHKSFYLLPLGK